VIGLNNVFMSLT